MTTPPSCCPAGSLGPAPEPAGFAPKGEMVRIPRRSTEGTAVAPITAYASGPRGAGAPPLAVIVGHDSFGIFSGRTRELCDRIAEELGILVVLPSFWPEVAGAGGEACVSAVARAFSPSGAEDAPEGFLQRTAAFFRGAAQAPWFLAALAGLKWAEVEEALTTAVLPWIHDQCGADRYAVVGFCWGGWFAAHASAMPNMVCAASLHPSLEVCRLVGEDMRTVCGAVRCPQMLLGARNDSAAVKEGGLADSIYRSKSFGHECVVQTFPDMVHGWVNRGDLADPAVSHEVERAMTMVVDFLRRHLFPA